MWYKRLRSTFMEFNKYSLRITLFIVLFFLCIGSQYILHAQSGASEEKSTDKQIKKLLVARIEVGDNIPKEIAAKVPPAFALTAYASNKYEMIRMSMNDSASKFLKAQGIIPTVSKVMEFLNVQKSVYINVQRLHNLLRVEVLEQGYPSYNDSQSGAGFALLRYRKGDSIIYDIPLLHALQRAFASAEKDSLMFDKADEDMRRYPAPTVVSTGIVFKDVYKNLNKIYDLKLQVINAYDAVQVMINAGKDHPKFTLLDIDTRDSIYAMLNLYGVENNRAPVDAELSMLGRIGIEYIITGTAENKKDFSEITLELKKLHKDGSTTFVRGVKEIITTDQIEDFRKAIERSTKVLLDGKTAMNAKKADEVKQNSDDKKNNVVKKKKK